MDAALKITIPADLTGCQALIEQLACTVESQTNTIDQLRQEKEELELELAEVIQRAYRNRSERYINDPTQLGLDLKGGDSAADAALRPDVWRREHPEAIRQYRVTERRDRADRKQYRRAARRRTHQPTR